MFETVLDMPDVIRLGLPREAQEVVRGMVHTLVYEDNLDAGSAVAKVQKGLKQAGYKWENSRWAPIAKRELATGVITKTIEEKKIAFGWANVISRDGKTVVDRQGDFIDDVWEIEKAAYDFVMRNGPAGDMHLRVGVGDLIESMVFTQEKIEKMGIPAGLIPEGWWIGFKVNDDEVWKAIRTGDYGGFSIHGAGIRKETEIHPDTHSDDGK